MTEHRTLDLAYWINEREAMRLRRARGANAPWSQDPHLTDVRYCNIRREEDKVTKWIARNWRDPNGKDPLLTRAMVAARMINLPETLEAIGYPHLPFDRWAANSVATMKTMTGKKWTSAYTISTCGKKMDKEDYVFNHVLKQVAGMGFIWADLSSAHARLMQVDGLGSFLAAQVIADLKNTPEHPLAAAEDWWTWSAPGPGSLRGLEAYYGQKVTPSQYHKAIRQCYSEVAPLLEPHVGKLHMQDFQNCLCEFSKYMRVKEGDGRVRNKYEWRPYNPR